MDKEQVLKNAREKMDKAISVAKEDFKSIRSSRASANLLDKIKIDYYGTLTPVKQVASINVPESQLITIQPWDKSLIQNIEKAIMSSDIGINPSNDGNIIRLNMPPLTEERRKKLIKVVHSKGEDVKIAIRNIRREANEELKRLQDEGVISKDEYYTEHDNIQKITDEHSHKIDELVKTKEEELMSV